MTKTPSISRKYHFSGRVQGVGFRWTTRDIAKGFSVHGYVKNLKDGRVEMVAQGEEATVTEFANAVAERFEKNVQGIDSAEDDSGEEFNGFVIRH